MNARRLRRNQARADGWRPARLRVYVAADLRHIDLSAELSPAAHAAWIRAVNAGEVDCVKCREPLSFDFTEEAIRRRPLLLGEARFRHDRLRQIVFGMCATCCLRFPDPEHAGDALGRVLHGLSDPRRLFTHTLSDA
jgi:hypothetical protein